MFPALLLTSGKEINQKGSGTERSMLMGFPEVQALITPWPNVESFLSFCFLKWHNAHYLMRKLVMRDCLKYLMLEYTVEPL